MGILRQKNYQPDLTQDFHFVDDTKIRLTLGVMADRYNEKARNLIYRAYSDPELMALYRGIRASGIYNKGGKVRRKILEIPSMLIMDFLDTVMGELYGPQWLDNKKALHHELVKHWWVVSKI